MKELGFLGAILFFLAFLSFQSGALKEMNKKAISLHQVERSSLILEKALREKEFKNKELKLEVAKLKAYNEHLKISLSKLSEKDTSFQDNRDGKRVMRTIASTPTNDGPSTLVEDYVQFDIYEWSPEKLKGLAEKSFHYKDYTKSHQFYAALIDHYPKHALVNDETYFKAGLSGYESGHYYAQSSQYLSKLIQEYPKSKYHRGAKLWRGLAHLKMGKHNDFMVVLEEFKSKYRNTREWSILSQYYEQLAYQGTR